MIEGYGREVRLEQTHSSTVIDEQRDGSVPKHRISPLFLVIESASPGFCTHLQ